MPKPSLKKNSSGTIRTIDGGDIRVHTFPKGTSPKVNVIERLKFELAYGYVAAQYVSCCPRDTAMDI